MAELNDRPVLGNLTGARRENLHARHPVPANGFAGVQTRQVFRDFGKRGDEAGEGNAVLDAQGPVPARGS
jgi:hypothetical protein